jgi:hypothetical protein
MRVASPNWMHFLERARALHEARARALGAHHRAHAGAGGEEPRDFSSRNASRTGVPAHVEALLQLGLRRDSCCRPG